MRAGGSWSGKGQLTAQTRRCTSTEVEERPHNINITNILVKMLINFLLTFFTGRFVESHSLRVMGSVQKSPRL